MQKIDGIMVTEHLLEIRYVASGSFLDVRGNLADYIRETNLFPHWRIEENVIHFHDGAQGIVKDGAFVGYKNAGYICHNAETYNYFEDKATSYWSKLIKNKVFSIPTVTRFGVRTKVFLNSKSSFEDIKKAFIKTFYSENTIQIVGGNNKDVSISLDMSEGDFDYKITMGPTHKSEAKNFFSFDSEYFEECGVFIDIDFFIEKDVAKESVTKLIKKAMELKWEKINRISASIGI